MTHYQSVRLLAIVEYGLILVYMAIPKIKATYSLDAETMKQIERLAHRWDTSKSEVLRRVVRAAAASESGPGDTGDTGALAALNRLHDSLGLSERAAAAWARRARAERRASSRHRGR